MNKDDIAEELYRRLNELKVRQNKALRKGNFEEVKECEYRISEVRRLMNILMLTE